MKMLSAVVALVLLTLRAWGHEGAPLGPNGGRLVEFSKDRSLRGEVTLVKGQFRVALLGADLKPVAIQDQVLVVTGGERRKPQKPEVRLEGGHFVFAALNGTEYPLVLQLRPTKDARPITAKFTYDAAICSACKQAEWLCKCGSHEAGDPKK